MCKRCINLFFALQNVIYRFHHQVFPQLLRRTIHFCRQNKIILVLQINKTIGKDDVKVPEIRSCISAKHLRPHPQCHTIGTLFKNSAHIFTGATGKVCPFGNLWPLKSGFLQIPPYDGHPCLCLSLPTAGRLRDFHPRERALTGRTNKMDASRKISGSIHDEKLIIQFR